jgi:tetratricopeptide (TPR) repeat protein
VPYVLADLASIQDDIASAIANTVREPFGPLADAEVRLIAGRDPNTFSAYECNVAFIFAVDRLSLSAREDAKSCLERYDSTGSLDETGLGALSFLYHLDYDDGFDLQHRETSSRDAAYDAAQRAVDINGNDVLAQMAMAFVHLAHRRFDQARIATERLMSLNPPMSTRGIVGLLMLKQGDREEGLRLIEAALTQTSRPTPSLYIGPTLFYMEQGDLPTAMSYAERMDAPEFTMFQVFWAALSAHLGQMDRARLNADTLLSMHPDFRVYGRELIGRWSLPPDVVDVLLSGLSLVGIDLD